MEESREKTFPRKGNQGNAFIEFETNTIDYLRIK